MPDIASAFETFTAKFHEQDGLENIPDALGDSVDAALYELLVMPVNSVAELRLKMRAWLLSQADNVSPIEPEPSDYEDNFDAHLKTIAATPPREFKMFDGAFFAALVRDLERLGGL